MKVKVLRDKDTKEFMHFVDFGGKVMVCTSELPNIQPMSATIELMKEMYPKEKFHDDCDNLDDFELMEYDLIEAGELGADIRNKLGPYNNLVALVKVLLNETDPNEKRELKKFIWKEIKQSKKSIKYIAKLL